MCFICKLQNIMKINCLRQTFYDNSDALAAPVEYHTFAHYIY